MPNQTDKKQIFPFADRGCVAVLGLFDGVHVAHRELISVGKDIAGKKALPLVIFTFSARSSGLKPHAERIYTDEEKLMLLSECGVDFTVIADFDSLRDMPHREFTEEILIRGLNAKHFVCGYNFKYGRGACGNRDTLLSAFRDAGRGGTTVGEITLGGLPVSSTRIRTLIGECRLSDAAALLGRPYFITGRTEHGAGLGRNMGIPTVNLDLSPQRSAPQRGVYATVASVGGRAYPALTNVGTCPTFGEREIHTETFILDFEGDVYGEQVTVHFIEFLREEKKFDSEKELIMQIDVDKNRAIRLLEDLKWQEIGLSLR